jgi:hypothetical protein
MSTAEAADALEISDENVKVRLDRGHSVLRRELAHRVGKSSRNVFALYGVRCDRVVRMSFHLLVSRLRVPVMTDVKSLRHKCATKRPWRKL